MQLNCENVTSKFNCDTFFLAVSEVCQYIDLMYKNINTVILFAVDTSLAYSCSEVTKIEKIEVGHENDLTIYYRLTVSIIGVFGVNGELPLETCELIHRNTRSNELTRVLSVLNHILCLHYYLRLSISNNLNILSSGTTKKVLAYARAAFYKCLSQVNIENSLNRIYRIVNIPTKFLALRVASCKKCDVYTVRNLPCTLNVKITSQGIIKEEFNNLLGLLPWENKKKLISINRLKSKGVERGFFNNQLFIAFSFDNENTISTFKVLLSSLIADILELKGLPNNLDIYLTITVKSMCGVKLPSNLGENALRYPGEGKLIKLNNLVEKLVTDSIVKLKIEIDMT